MAATVYQFPKLKTFKGLKIPLYNEEEIYTTVLAVNCFGTLPNRIDESNLTDLEPIDVMKALYEARYSSVFSSKTKQIIDRILKSIEAI
jgi:hypothetical protein